METTSSSLNFSLSLEIETSTVEANTTVSLSHVSNFTI